MGPVGFASTVLEASLYNRSKINTTICALTQDMKTLALYITYVTLDIPTNFLKCYDGLYYLKVKVKVLSTGIIKCTKKFG